MPRASINSVGGCEILLVAQAAGVLKLGNLSLDGSKIHADASRRLAVSYQRLVELKQEVQELLSLGEQADQGEAELPEGLVLEEELNLRQVRLVNLAKARKVLEERANERYAAEKAEYEAKMKERSKKARKRHHKPQDRPPKAPEPGLRDKNNTTSLIPIRAL